MYGILQREDIQSIRRILLLFLSFFLFSPCCFVARNQTTILVETNDLEEKLS